VDLLLYSADFGGNTTWKIGVRKKQDVQVLNGFFVNQMAFQEAGQSVQA
jgi:hypothetical protein